MLETHKRTLNAVRTLCQQLLEAGVGSGDFFRRLLPGVVKEGQLLAAAVWLHDDHSRLRLVSEFNLSSLSETGQFFVDPEHQDAVAEVMEQTKVRTLLGRQEDLGSVKPHSLAIGPIVRDERSLGAIEIFAEAEETDEPYLHDLIELLSGYCSKAIAKPTTVPSAPRPAAPAAPGAAPLGAAHATQAPPPSGNAFWEQFDRFLHGLRRLDVREVAANAANDGRALLGCDRVSVAIREGKRIKVRAVSGQEDVHQRANMIRTMTNLTRRVMKTGERLLYTGSADNLPPPLEKPLSDYLAESRMRMVAMLPLIDPRRSAKTDVEGQPIRKRDKRAIVGCLIVEQANESDPRVGLMQKVELIVPHVAEAVADAEQHESIFLLPLWRTIGRTQRWFRGRRLATAIAVVLGLAVVGAALAFTPWTYRVTADGRLMPTIQHEVFAPENGEVEDIKVHGGEQVNAGDPLIILRNPELQAEIVATQSEAIEKEKHAVALGHQAYESRLAGKTEEAVRFDGEQIRAQTEGEGLRNKLEVLKGRAERLIVRSPAKGTVATFQVEQLLRDRPVQRGERLLEVMDESRDWRLELDVPEHRMGHLLRAMKASSDQTLPLEYVPATAVETTLKGKLRAADIATRANQSQDEGAIVEVYAEINQDDVKDRRIGAEVTAKVDCGKRSLFYVLFGDVVEFVQRHVWW
jgi:multidrug efflux pump subunit AcrA (membrane-fusion protein)